MIRGVNRVALLVGVVGALYSAAHGLPYARGRADHFGLSPLWFWLLVPVLDGLVVGVVFLVTARSSVRLVRWVVEAFRGI